MTDDIAEDEARYWAFISYSHRDAAFGRRLHRRLENYALPRRLVGRETAQGAIPRKLAIFRDREELPAAHDLSTEVRAALKASRSLIVVCSPSSAASQWVGREIEVFRELHPDRPILAAVRDGEPADSFPKALHGVGADGTAIEPLAADFRRGRDGEQLGLLKLVAGIVGLGLDELVQRDAHRRNQRVTAVTAAALAGMVVMGVLTAFALNARHEADRQRGEAEGLVEYMLTDLHDKLKGVGRLDIMTAVNKRALKYFDNEIDRLDSASRAQRARVLQALGADDEDRGEYTSALKRFQEAKQATGTLLAETPNDPARIFDHAQSEYWIGSMEFQRDQFTAAKTHFLAYKQLSDRLVSIAPSEPKYHLEVGYAESNLCAVALKGPPDPRAAIAFCIEALAQTEEAARHLGPSTELTDNLIDRHAWLADSFLANGNVPRARAERIAQEDMLKARIRADPKNMDMKDTWIAMQRAFAKLDRRENNEAAARLRLEQALKVADDMIGFDPTNHEWVRTRMRILQDLSNAQNPKTQEGKSP